MSTNNYFTKENLDNCLKALAKEFRKRNGKTMPAEIILVGGAAVLVNYGFRDKTYDVDAIIHESSAMKEAKALVKFEREYPNVLNGDNLQNIIESLKAKRTNNEIVDK